MGNNKKLFIFMIFVFVLLFLLAIDLSMFFIVCPALVVSGYYVRKRSKNNISRAIGLATMVIGVVIALLLILSMITTISSVRI